MYLIVGGGLIAEEYIKCLIAFNIEFEIVVNTEKTKQKLLDKYNHKCYSGGLEIFTFDKKYDNIIIATPIQFLFNHLKLCILNNNHLKNILIEKPGCMYSYQLKEIIAIKKDVEIFIAYNRRFYSSIIEGKQIINDDPIEKLNLTIDEYNLDNIAKQKSYDIMENTFANMTTHVVDVAFYLAGVPKQINVLNINGYGELYYHKKAAIFNGNGITENNIEFEYNGNWTHSGKWKMEFHLKSGKILSYQPLENLKIINVDGSEQIITQNEIDTLYKPGYYKQINSFIKNKQDLLNIENHYKNQQIFHEMVGQNPNHYNILLIGCGNIGFRHLNSFAKTNLPLNIHIIELSDDNIKIANDYIENCDNVNVFFYKDVNDICESYFDICTIATCSDVRLMLVENIIKNDKIKYISNMVLEKVIFQNMNQFEEYSKLIQKFKNCNTFVSTHARHNYNTYLFDKFINPKIDISGGNWGLLCNSVHYIVFLLYFKNDFALKFEKFSDIIDSKRNKFKEIYGRFFNDDISIACNDSEEKSTISFKEDKNKLIIEISNTLNFFYYENDILIENFSRDYLHTSVYFENEYQNLLLHKETNLCKFDKGLLAHKIFFDAIKHLFNTEILPIT